MDRPSWYFDGEWLHFKSVGEYERSEGGWAVNSKGVNVTYEGSEHSRCNKHTGCQVCKVELSDLLFFYTYYFQIIQGPPNDNR